MPLDLAPFEDVGLSDGLLETLIAEHESRVVPALARFWSYYRNPATLRDISGSARSSLRPYRLAQESGLPGRQRDQRSESQGGVVGAGREVVIENDIAWRVDALVDFVFGKPVRIASTARDPNVRDEIEAILDAVWEASGGISLLQDMGLLGAVFGHSDLTLRSAEMFEFARRLALPAGDRAGLDRVLEAARRMRIEVIEAARGIPMLDPTDYRRVLAYVIRSQAQLNEVEFTSGGSGGGVARNGGVGGGGILGRVLERVGLRSAGVGSSGGARFGDGRLGRRRVAETLEIISASHHQVYIDGELIVDRESELGELPVAHVQNSSQPFHYEGLSDVEPLIPIQDELNTRLSDRAHRVTLQSFNMYLVKGLDGMQQPGGLRVAPGQVWLTDNPDAQVQAFGGDGDSPSEESHIEQLRDAMDKISGVSPVAIGVIRAKLGNLSSENALRITLMGVLSKASRKRVSYGRGMAEMSRMALKALDIAGVYRTSERDRGIRIEWSDPLPTDEKSRLVAAQLRRDLGVPADRVLAGIGEGGADTGIG